MTRKEKEKLVLDALGLKVGDIVNIKFSNIENKEYEIKKYDYYFALDGEGTLSISSLLNFDFEKIVAKKKKGEMKCEGMSTDNGCKNCPLKTLYRCGCSNKTETVNDCLESIKEYIDPRVYEAYKDALNDEVEE